MSLLLSVTFAECHTKAPYAECHYAECHYAECHYAECHYAECHYAECHYAECRGAIICKSIFQIDISECKNFSV